MSYWYETPYDQKDSRHWLNIAISLAYTLGLHRNQEGSGLSVRTKNMWKRVWWCCYMRDRLVAFATKGITRISDGDFDARMLTTDDFGIDPFPNYNLTTSFGCTTIQDEQTQKDLAALCIAKAKLCLCISHLLRAEYTVLCPSRRKAQRQESNSEFLRSQKSLDCPGDANPFDAELMNWARRLTLSCRYQTTSCDDIENGRPCITIQRALLHMLYFAAVSAVPGHQVLQVSETPANALKQHTLQYPLCDKLRMASGEITKIGMDLLNLKLVWYLPTSGATALLYAIRVHILDVTSPSDTVRQRAAQGLEKCMVVLESLRTDSASADYASRILQARFNGAVISRP